MVPPHLVGELKALPEDILSATEAVADVIITHPFAMASLESVC